MLSWPLLLLGSGALGGILRPEEHWREAGARDARVLEKHDWFRNRNRTGEADGWVSGTSSRKELGRPRAACGVEGPAQGHNQDRIVGGSEAAPHQFPWMAGIYVNGYLFCGGTFISEHYVLTAAHCVDGGFYFDILAGAHNVKSGYEEGRVEISSYTGIVHPGWDPAIMAADLALIELPEPLPLGPTISLSCLPPPGSLVQPGLLTSITGWGKLYDGSSAISPTLQMVHDLPTMSNEDCNAVYEGIAGEGVVCVDTKGGHGSCHGDSGGPLTTKAAPRAGAGQVWIQIGIVSFGSGECEGGFPAGFTRTEHYLDWILEETGLTL